MPDQLHVFWHIQSTAIVGYYDILVVNKTFNAIQDAPNPTAIKEVCTEITVVWNHIIELENLQ